MFAKSLLVSLALAAVSVHANLDISTPNELRQCEEATFVISGATGSVWPFVVDSNHPCDDPLRELKDVTGVLKWKPDLPVGTNVMVAIEDDAGNEAWSGKLTITPGSDSSCIYSNSSPTSVSSSAPASSHSAATTSGGPDTPRNAANSNLTNPTGGAAPARVAASGVSILTILSALALAL